jgi:catalase (peroxidase I)
LLINEEWKEKKWNGPLQYVNSDDEDALMMLPTDMALIWDPEFKKYVDVYAKDNEKFFKDFSAAFSKLLELGVPRQKM